VQRNPFKYGWIGFYKCFVFLLGAHANIIINPVGAGLQRTGDESVVKIPVGGDLVQQLVKIVFVPLQYIGVFKSVDITFSRLTGQEAFPVTDPGVLRRKSEDMFGARQVRTKMSQAAAAYESMMTVDVVLLEQELFPAEMPGDGKGFYQLELTLRKNNFFVKVFPERLRHSKANVTKLAKLKLSIFYMGLGKGVRRSAG